MVNKYAVLAGSMFLYILFMLFNTLGFYPNLLSNFFLLLFIVLPFLYIREKGRRDVFYVLFLLPTAIFLFFVANFLYGYLAGNDVFEAIGNIKFYLFLVLFYPFFVLLKEFELDKVLYVASQLLFYKFLVLSIILVGLYLCFEIVDDFFSGSSIIINDFYNLHRLFDKTYVFFPFVFIYCSGKSLIIRYMVFSLVLILMFFSATVSLWAYYFVFVSIYFFSIKRFLFWSLVGVSVMLIQGKIIISILTGFYEYKLHSVSVKAEQYNWFIEHFSDMFWGYGFGYSFEISYLKGFLIENFYIYLISIYGIVGTLLFLVFAVLIPIVMYRGQKMKYKKLLYLTHCSLLFNSISNPYMLSVPAFLPLVVIYVNYLKNIYRSHLFLNNSKIRGV